MLTSDRLKYLVIGDRRTLNEIANDFARGYGKKPKLERLGSLNDPYNTMQAFIFRRRLSLPTTPRKNFND